MKKDILATVAGLVMTVVILAGCSTGVMTQSQAGAQTIEKKPAVSQFVSNEDDKKIKQLISDYFVKMYAVSVEDYQKNSELGNIPDNLHSFVAKRTIEEGNNNIEVGLNFPRYVEINGCTMISYTPIMKLEDKTKPDIEATYIEENNGTLLYFVKMSLKAQCITDELFETNYTLNEKTNTYGKKADTDKSKVDSFPIQARYDVELIKEGQDYKILRAVESTYKQSARSRLYRYNNDFVNRLDYLNLQKDGDTYINKDDGAVYDKEKAIILKFFEDIIDLDTGRRALLSASWDKGLTEFKSLADTIGITKNKDKKEVITFDSDYKSNFPKKALLLQNDIYRIQPTGKFADDCSIKLHPAYSEKKKWYIVTFNAGLTKTNSAPGSSKQYNFDYLVRLAENNKEITVESMQLNCMNSLEEQGEESAQKGQPPQAEQPVPASTSAVDIQ